jgi:MobC-like protein
MGRTKTPENFALKYKLTTKVKEQTYRKLEGLLKQDPLNDMSSLVRTILEDRPVRIFTRDLTAADIVEELAHLRTEIGHIGININQITKKFNSYPEHQRKGYYAKLAFDEYLTLAPRVEHLIILISERVKKWLPE